MSDLFPLFLYQVNCIDRLYPPQSTLVAAFSRYLCQTKSETIEDGLRKQRQMARKGITRESKTV